MPRLKDMTGQKFGRLTVLYRCSENSSCNQVMWHCKCECGQEVDVSGQNLRRGSTKSCGCLIGKPYAGGARKNIKRAKPPGKVIDLTGQKFGKLTVLKREKSYDHISWWRCKCDCGNEIVVRGNALRCGRCKSCGCSRNEHRHSIDFSKKALYTNGNLKGQIFGELTVIRPKKDKQGLYKWLCKCECGNDILASTSDLIEGRVSHCGCLKASISKQRIYNIWFDMNRRCTNPNYSDYDNYGGRGISVCDEWQEYGAFEEWAESSGYSDDLTLDRIDVNKGYSPDNCRWATHYEQNNNKRNTHWVTYNGKTQSLKQWADELGMSPDLLGRRLRSGWSVERAFTQAVRKQESKHKGRQRILDIRSGIKKRCYGIYRAEYKNYGGRGIKVYQPWLDNKEEFISWALANGYRDDLTLDRIDVDGDYTPDNCRWVTTSEQNRNKTTSRYLTYNGKTQTLVEWSEEVGIKASQIGRRIKRGWTIEEALTTPSGQKRSKANTSHKA